MESVLPLQAPRYRERNDHDGFTAYMACVQRCLDDQLRSTVEQQDAIRGAYEDLARVETRFTWRERRFRGLLGRLDLLKEHEMCLERIDRHDETLVRLAERVAWYERRIAREQEAFYASPFARQVAQEHPKAYARFLERKRRA